MKARVCLSLTVLLSLLLACVPKQPPPRIVPTAETGGGDSRDGETRAFRNVIRAEPIPTKNRLEFRAELLPRGARGRFASFDGDTFTVNIPPRQSDDLTAQQVLDQTVAPLLQAMGFGSRLRELTPGNPAGEKLPRANLRQVATETCREVATEQMRRFQPVCQALSTGESNPIAEQVIRLAYDMSLAQFVADFERQKTHYVFAQRAAQNVPIEHVGLVAERNDGESITTIHGTLFNRYGITNSVRLKPEHAVRVGQKHIFEIRGIDRKAQVDQRRPQTTLVLLPYGSAPDGSIGLRYAYRTLLFARPLGWTKDWLSWMAWIDADNGSLLELAPQFDDISASGIGWRRDPNTPTQAFFFQVDPAVGGQYTLQRAGVVNRLDRLGDGAFDDEEVSIPDMSGGSSATFANFNQAPLNDSANALCAAGMNNTWRQVNAFIHLNAFRDMIAGAGTFPTFPQNALTVRIDLPQPGNGAGYDTIGMDGLHVMNLGTGGLGFTDAACPDVPNGVLSGSNDVTGMTHEFTHISTKRLQERRPLDWCGMPGCSMPNSAMRIAFHDFADAWAHHYASTPCMAGWYRKNMGGTDVSENCVSHTETGSLPRLASVNEPFDTATILDHFPERRATFTGDYEDGQIVAAAMWLTRQGMRSKCLPSGTPQTWLRINRGLYDSGMILSTCVGCDRDIYRFAQNLLEGLANQWATAGLPGGPPGFAHNGNHTTNKLLSGWARAGIFLIPYECIDGDAATGNPTFCPVMSGGENGGDAIVDVRDNDPLDDLTIDQIQHPEFDWSKRGDIPPTFRVWTGPRFKFDAAGVANNFTPSMGTPSPCNTKFRVELASDDAFTINVVNGDWTDVSTTAQPECYGTWTPDPGDWTTLSGMTGSVKVYYRVRTRDAADGNEKISTSPGSGSYGVPPSYLVVNDAGQP